MNNQKHVIRIVTIGVICLIYTMIYPIFAGQEQHEVLILNSYHSSLTWTKQQTESIVKELAYEHSNARLHIEYMDWKNFPNVVNLDNLYRMYKEKYRNLQLDVVVATDDTALEFALKHREKLFSNAPIVFSGINIEGERTLLKDQTNITGVIEPIGLEETVAMALQINPQVKELYIIYDQTESGRSTYALVENIISLGYKDITPIGISNVTYKELTEQVGELRGDCAVLILNFYTDFRGRGIEFEDVCKMISDVSQVPVFSIYDMTLGYGNIGGSMLSGAIQGERAGQLALRILKGEKADQIPIINDNAMKLAFDYNQLQRFNIPMKLIPEGAEVINEPFSFFKTYRNLVLTTLLILFLLIIFIIILMIYIKEIQRVKKALQESNEEITQTYEELTASDEELQLHVEELNAIQRKLRRMSYEDGLTRLPNKRALHEDFNVCKAKYKDKKRAVIFIDADNFKLINDTLGHSIGDRFIIEIGKRLQSLVDDTAQVYRMGGDEFILLLHNIEEVDEIEKVGNRIIEGFKKGFKISNMAIHTSVSAGIAIFPEHGVTAEELIMRADIAMYKAKEQGRSKYVVYDPKMNQDLIERVNIEKNLREAISNEELILYYQPQYNMRTREIIGFEALIRWDSKELGWVMPCKFIQIAEDNHTIIPIGIWVLRTACQFIKKVHNLGHKDYTMAVNISLLQIMQEDFVEMVLSILKECDLDAQYLELEMTETMLIQNFKWVVEKLGILRDKGVRVALDDFGTGYSSLNYINQLPINILKIDKSFVDTISSHEEQKVIINILISLGHRMGLEVIAEGVETEEEYAYLHRYGCDSLQGYLFSKPLTEGEILELLEEKS